MGTVPEMKKQRVAVVGTGVAGMAAAYFLRHDCEIVFYEKNAYPGGHTNTVTVDEDGRPVYIDTGFMVYNEVTYPNLIRFFSELNIPVKNTSMSFSVQHLPTGLEYCGTGIAGLFSQRKNLFNLSYIRMLSSIHRFNQECVEVLENKKYERSTISEYVREKRLGPDILEKYLLPMSAAIWSTPPDKMMNFPAATLVRFFKNHGLLGLTTHYQWKTVEGGSRVYRDKVLSLFPGSLKIGRAATQVSRNSSGVLVRDSSGGEASYDRVVIASHADEALAMLQDAKPLEKELLGKFRYQKNQAMLHTDESVMPRARKAWSSWNYRIEKDRSASVIYWMNSLQGVSDKKNYFVSINDPGRVDPSKILWQKEYEHPIYDLEAIQAQEKLNRLNAEGPVYFCGSYFKYGFHEDAFTAGKEAAQALLGRGSAG